MFETRRSLPGYIVHPLHQFSMACFLSGERTMGRPLCSATLSSVLYTCVICCADVIDPSEIKAWVRVEYPVIGSLLSYFLYRILITMCRPYFNVLLRTFNIVVIIAIRQRGMEDFHCEDRHSIQTMSAP